MVGDSANLGLVLSFSIFKVAISLIEDFYIFNCPNCDDEIIVQKNELNCKIFRHAIYKHNYEQVNLPLKHLLD